MHSDKIAHKQLWSVFRKNETKKFVPCRTLQVRMKQPVSGHLIASGMRLWSGQAVL